MMLLNLNTNISRLNLKPGSTTNFKRNIDGSSGVTVGNLDRQLGSKMNFGGSANKDSILAQASVDSIGDAV